MIENGNLTESTSILMPSFAASKPIANLAESYQNHEISVYPFQVKSKFDTSIIEKWLKSGEFSKTEWSMNWNPAFVAHRSVPYFDERFISVDHEKG